jgi:hypothetical protein
VRIANVTIWWTIGEKLMLREQKYTPGLIDGRWTNGMIDKFNGWAASKGSKLRLNKN